MPESKTQIREIVITENTVLDRAATLAARIVVRNSHVVIDGNGATLVGPGVTGIPESYEGTGIAISAEGCHNVTLRNINAKGFEAGLSITNCKAWVVEDCDFSDNYHNMAFGWGELPPRGGIQLRGVSYSVFLNNKANRVWDGLNLVDSDENLFMRNNFSRCSNVCAKLWNSSRNKFIENDLSYGLRIDRAAGEVHARDSTGVLIETESNDNYWFRNDVSNGGDGVFLRPLNGWVSTGNVFIENDCSYANNNCFESWSPKTVYIRNKANHGSYGFWLGGSDQTLLMGNEAAYNGLPGGFHNAPEKLFGHGGIVLVGAAGSHCMLDGNVCHNNNGGGIVFRGDVPTAGSDWKIEHWVIQNNDLRDNKWGIWGLHGTGIEVRNNKFSRNAERNCLENVEIVEDDRFEIEPGVAPTARMDGPSLLRVGEVGTFNASAAAGLEYAWQVGEEKASGPTVNKAFSEPGFYRVSLTVTNGLLSDIAWKDLIVAEEPAKGSLSDGDVSAWAASEGELVFSNDSEALIGESCLRMVGKPNGEESVAASRSGLSGIDGKTAVSFWIKFRNPNLPAFEGAGPVITIASDEGKLVLTPTKERNYLFSPIVSEGRWLWARYVISLEGDDRWEKTTVGSFDSSSAHTLTFSVRSGGEEPFTVWLNNLVLE